MATAKVKDWDPWLMDDSVLYDPSELEGFSLPSELQAKIDAIFDGPPEKTQAA